MSTSNWKLYVEDNVLVADFAEGMPSDAEEYRRVNEQFERLATRGEVDAHMSVLNMSASLNSDVFEKAQEAAEVGTEYGITKWAIVSEGIKSLALKGKVEEMGVETMTSDDEAEALDWARN
ncbi:hypothetical protein KTS45_07540 [Halomicroarcula limicola]|uniref:Uncharacterized protein n=1 Tax=Haloarcula limicola TaxID=1429915 RepID=A0A8J8C7Z5_9EURY|nr:hypothetical protein [Halomicroarcula limicola]MBV0924055.1 hypothetical protein [Halomicroarcula limicola]